ncbi:hypothetical protein BU17DRAFT_103354 [Hysterangium stoloniferum]|nr:hypothetical protein BU17DRAFT_103354 [Hysterangium stoloniferum]
METLGKERTLSRLRHWFRVYLNDKNIKDDEEKRLEALLFGTSFPGAATGVFTNQEAVANDLNVEIGGGLVDSDLFYVDNTGPAFKDDSRQRGDSRAAAVLNSDRKKKAAWVDLDDVNIEVSLASDNRLRKLRDAPVEDIIKGRDYETRLRRQFEKNPDPEWASAARDRLRGQKRRRASQSSQSASASGDEDRITSLINSSGKLLVEWMRKRSLETVGGSHRRSSSGGLSGGYKRPSEDLESSGRAVKRSRGYSGPSGRSSAIKSGRSIVSGMNWSSGSIANQRAKTQGVGDFKMDEEARLKGELEKMRKYCMIHLLMGNELIQDHAAAKCTMKNYGGKVIDIKKDFRFPRGLCIWCGCPMSWGQKMHKWDPDPEVQARRSCRYEDLVVPIFWLTYTAECMELKDGVWAEFSPEDEDGPIGFEEDGDERYRYFAWLMSVEEGQWIHNVFPVLLHFWERCAVNKGA